MKINIIWLLSILVLSCTSSPETTSATEDKKKYNFIKTFEGELGDKYPVMMKLKCDNGLVTGNYYYKNKGQELEVKGEIKSNSDVSLKEFDGSGNQTGNFQGNIEDEKKITGNWSKPNGDNKMGFVLLETNSDYNSILNDFQELKSIVGRYENPFNEGDVSGVVIISNLRGNKFDFEITSTHAQGCTGEAKGTGIITKGKTGKYSARGCKLLEFQFFTSEVKIEEDDCDDLHGMRCYFSGTYNKKI